MVLPVEITVVLADDNAGVRKGIRTMLKKHPGILLVGEAATGKEAIWQVERTLPQVLLLDISMPDMDGIDAARALIPRHPQMHILILSAYDDHQLITEVCRCGCAGYVLKDKAPQVLVDKIWQVAGIPREPAQRVH
jgi:DNA-binding NarL/FixJ family response regulator